MANRRFIRGDISTLTPGIAKLYGYVEIGTSGVISTTVPAKCEGFTIIKTAAKTGRYTITLDDKYLRLLSVGVTLNASNDAAYITDAGLATFVRAGDAITNGVSRSFFLQFARALTVTTTVTYADAEPETGAEFMLEITLKNRMAGRL